MTDSAENGTVQGNGLEVTDEDIRPSKESPTSTPKAEKSQEKSQPQPKDGGAKDKGPGPWQSKLVEAGLNDPRFDEFIRSEIQPYITQLEQGGGGTSEVWNGDTELEQAAYQLITEMRNDPVAAFYELGQVLGLIDDAGNIDEQGGADPLVDEFGEEESGVPDDPRLSYIDEMMRKEQEAEEDAAYNQFLTSIAEKVPGFDPDLYTQFLISAGGDLDRAWETYMRYHRDPEPAPDAPPTLGGPEGTTPPPAPAQHDSIGSAVESFLSEARASKRR